MEVNISVVATVIIACIGGTFALTKYINDKNEQALNERIKWKNQGVNLLKKKS